MLIDHTPEISDSSTAVSGNRKVFVHEGRTQVLSVKAVEIFMFQRDGVTRSQDLLHGVLLRISAVHPVAGVIVLSSLVNDGSDVRAFATLVSRAPRQHAGVVPVAQHHPAGALAVHGFELRHVRDAFAGVSLVPALVKDVQAVLVCELQITVHGWIVRCSYAVEIELLEYFHVAADGGLVHGVACLGVLHVRVDCAHFYGLPVEVEHAVLHLRLLESYLLCHLLQRPA